MLQLVLAALAVRGPPLPTRALPAPPPRRVSLRLSPDGTLTRTSASVQAAAAQAVYDNTCPQLLSYYTPQASPRTSGGTHAWAYVDTGRLPSPTLGESVDCRTGCRESYSIDGFQIGYTTTTGAPVTAEIHFWSEPPGGSCPTGIIGGQDPPAVPPTASFTLTGLPRSPAAGVRASYLVDLDLGGQGFRLRAAARFSWSISLPGTTDEDGPLPAGCNSVDCLWPSGNFCPTCTGTVWEQPAPTSAPGTGLGNSDTIVVETYGSTSVPTGCYWFASHATGPFAGLHLELWSHDPCPPGPGVPFCDGADGSTALCPCGNPGYPAAGCASSITPSGVHLETDGQDAAAGSASFLSSGYRGGTTPTAILLRSRTREPVPVAFGDGLRCIGLPGLVRLTASTAAGGIASHLAPHGAGPGTFHYQVWYRDNVALFCVTTGPSGGTFNLSSGWTLTW